jgi:BMFP domain-containing protein YqiC
VSGRIDDLQKDVIVQNTRLEDCQKAIKDDIPKKLRKGRAKIKKRLTAHIAQLEERIKALEKAAGHQKEDSASDIER